MQTTDDKTDESSSGDDPLSELARAADEAAGNVPLDAWLPGQGLSYEVKKPRPSSKEGRLQKIAIAAIIIAVTSLLIETVMFGAALLDLPEELNVLLGFAAFVTMMAALSMASLASRDGGNRRLIMSSRILAFAWMPLSLAAAAFQGANVGGLACIAIVLVGVAGFLMILAIVAREMLLAYL